MGIKQLFKYLMKTGQAMAKVLNGLVLSIFFFIVITPVSIILRLMGKDFMNLRNKAQEDSYWVRREVETVDYSRQF